MTRLPAVLRLDGNPLRPTADGPSTAARFFLTAAEKEELEKKAPAGIPTSISLVAFRIGGGLTPQRLFEAVQKLKAADTQEKMDQAATELKDLLGPEGVRQFTREGRLDIAALLESLTLTPTSTDTNSPEVKRAEAFRRAVEGAADLSAAPPSSASPTPPGGETPPGPPGGETPPGTPTDPSLTPPGDLGGLGTLDPAAQFGQFNPNDALLDNQAKDEIDRLNDEIDRLRNQANQNRNNNNDKNRNPGLGNDKGNGGGDNQQPPQITPPSLGGGAGGSKGPGQPPPLPQMPQPQQAPEFQAPPAVADVQLSPEVLRALSGADIGSGKSPYGGTSIDDILNGFQENAKTALSILTAQGLQMNAAIQNGRQDKLTVDGGDPIKTSARLGAIGPRRGAGNPRLKLNLNRVSPSRNGSTAGRAPSSAGPSFDPRGRVPARRASGRSVVPVRREAQR